MAASTITRDTWTNDSGTTSAPVGDGTILNNSVLQNHIYARIDAMFAGTGSYTTFELGGLLKVDGFGTHTFSAGGTGANTISIRNTTAGTANYGLLAVGNDSSATLCQLYALSSTFTTSGQFVANGINLSCTGAGGISIATNNAAGVIRLYTGNGVQAMGLDASGVLTVNGFGAHTFSAGGTGVQSLLVRNTTAGTGNAAELIVGNDASSGVGVLGAFSSTFTTSAANVANGTTLAATGAGGLSIWASNAAGAIRFYSGGNAETVRITTNGGVGIGTTTNVNSGRLTSANGVDVGEAGGGSNWSRVNGGVFTVLTSASATVNQLDGTGLLFTTWPTTASAANANVANADYIRLVTSLRVNKHDIKSIAEADAVAAVRALRPVLYRSRVDDDQRQWPGFIAEEVAEAAPHLAIYGPDGALQSVAYDRVPAYLVAAVQALTARVSALEAA